MHCSDYLIRIHCISEEKINCFSLFVIFCPCDCNCRSVDADERGTVHDEQSLWLRAAAGVHAPSSVRSLRQAQSEQSQPAHWARPYLTCGKYINTIDLSHQCWSGSRRRISGRVHPYSNDTEGGWLWPVSVVHTQTETDSYNTHTVSIKEILGSFWGYSGLIHVSQNRILSDNRGCLEQPFTDWCPWYPADTVEAVKLIQSIGANHLMITHSTHDPPADFGSRRRHGFVQLSDISTMNA